MNNEEYNDEIFNANAGDSLSMSQMMKNDPDTIRLTVSGVEIMVNRPKHYVGCLDSSVDMPKFVRAVMYLKKEGFLDECEN